MKYSSQDSGFLSVFRLFIGIQLGYEVLTALISTWLRPGGLSLQPVPFVGIGEAALLLVYLSIPQFQEVLGKSYIPIALGVALIAPIVDNALDNRLLLQNDVIRFRAIAGQSQATILLLVPVILMSWRYSFRTAAITSLLLAGLDIFLAFPLIASFGWAIWPVTGVVFYRTAILLLIAFVVNRLSKAQREQNTRLARANQQLAASANTLEQLTISRERNRMARELHDTLAHSLSAVAVQLEAVGALWDSDRERSREMLDDSLRLTRNGLSEARLAIQALRAAPLEDLGLGLALRSMAGSEAERGGFTLESHIPEEFPRLQPEVEHSVYRIAEEALRNVTRHARAAHVSLALIQNDGTLELSIRDDGCGFADSPSFEANHFGLRGMHERAESVGAVLDIHSRPGEGTAVQLRMNLTPGNPTPASPAIRGGSSYSSPVKGGG